jgi:predicted  nucleic acid-binding Zn-ribbon protein
VRELYKTYSEETASVQFRLRAAQTGLADAEYKLLPLQTENSKLTRERDLLKSHVAEMEQELKAKLNELIELRAGNLNERENFLQRIANLESELEEKTVMLSSAQVCSLHDYLLCQLSHRC